MNAKALLTAVGAIWAVSPLAEQRARACEPQPPVLEATSLADGAVAPTNPVVAFTWSNGRAQYLASYRVQGSTTAIELGLVPSNVWAWGEVPTLQLPELAPGTRITVELDGQERTQSEQVSFTYGAERDTNPPAAPAAPVLSLEAEAALADGPCSSGAPASEHVVAAFPPRLPAEVAVYAVYSRTAGDLGASLASYRLTSQARTTPLAAATRVDPAEVCVHARTMDHAGNWSAPSPESCVAVMAGGCTTVQQSLPSLGALAFGLVGLCWQRRRRVNPRG